MSHQIFPDQKISFTELLLAESILVRHTRLEIASATRGCSYRSMIKFTIISTSLSKERYFPCLHAKGWTFNFSGLAGGAICGYT
ncbi:hypothetical protein Plhal304r1_c036g0110251 [Plasmopara halstedii]